ncbi:putative adenylyltransferase/sulfurtransferase MoeZ [Thalassovita gelatinovora]|uniref:Molybdopterin-synthase adenylyltransferase n=1 Tax=Thalassovita gelatinovora TaxID=53501 RepID=A0A0P1FCR3_THAGE|nr:HesA/MoeB/ThiF family protein [Thalassovita gelatinovora]QIZ80535.1 HesA/MoeB/ThiF family protein [Thalassovita gelatinovora]CUH66009.1 putative adenylyltransferase/sulfurtransferase MoeZ [Thalassovita gelatinovora]SEQ75400.1 Molybdopterin or thiamine biosynthesis adenylyltransferase [Thalassovita gelatinovora]
MGLVLIIAAALWVIGAALKTPYALRGLMIGLLWLAVVALHLVLPEGHVLRQSTGGSAAPWLLLGGFVVLVLVYRQGLGWARNRAQPEPGTNTKPAGSFSETELNRYARHIMLREIGGTGQKKLKNARVLVIGAGGLGAPALMYLAAAGVGTIGVIDDDEVDNSNLQRQVIHRDADIGSAKVFSAKATMQAQNPFVTVRPYKRRLEPDMATELFSDYDLILDGTDNFTTRYLSNETAVKLGKPLISGALSQWEGQLSVFDPATSGPCYQCIFPEAPAPGLAPSCAEAGVIGPLPGVVGAMMAVEAIKLITGAGAALRGEMLIYDALWGETRKIRLKPRDDCPICGGH